MSLSLTLEEWAYVGAVLTGIVAAAQIVGSVARYWPIHSIGSFAKLLSSFRIAWVICVIIAVVSAILLHVAFEKSALGSGNAARYATVAFTCVIAITTLYLIMLLGLATYLFILLEAIIFAGFCIFSTMIVYQAAASILQLIIPYFFYFDWVFLAVAFLSTGSIYVSFYLVARLRWLLALRSPALDALEGSVLSSGWSVPREIAAQRSAVSDASVGPGPLPAPKRR